MRRLLWIILPILFFTVSCDNKDNAATPDLGFTKIVGSNEYTGNFYPWDVIQTDDNGFLALSSSNSSAFKNILLTKVDKNGEIEWELADSSDYKNPVGKIFEQNGSLYIFAMQQVTLNTHLLRINIDTKELESVQSYEDFFYPIAASEVPNGFIVECFDRDSERIRLMKLDNNFNEQWRSRYSVFEDPVEFNNHLTLENPLPYFCGYVGTSTSASYYYFGGMYQFTLTTAFVNITDGSLEKRISGFRYDAGVSGLLHTSGNNFFLTKHNVSKETSILPNFEIDIASGGILNSQNTTDIPENVDFEIASDARTILEKMTINNQEILVHATESKNQETVLNFYDLNSNKLASKRIGVDSAYLLGNLTPTSDGGLLVLCHTFIAGRISRLVFIKLPKEEIEQLL